MNQRCQLSQVQHLFTAVSEVSLQSSLQCGNPCQYSVTLYSPLVAGLHSIRVTSHGLEELEQTVGTAVQAKLGSVPAAVHTTRMPTVCRPMVCGLAAIEREGKGTVFEGLRFYALSHYQIITLIFVLSRKEEECNCQLVC